MKLIQNAGKNLKTRTLLKEWCATSVLFYSIRPIVTLNRALQQTSLTAIQLSNNSIFYSRVARACGVAK